MTVLNKNHFHMSRSSYIAMTNDVKSKLSDIIIKFNYIELVLKKILLDYSKSARPDFVNEILFHNSVISFNTKLSILKYILTKEGIIFKDWEKFHKLINIRNAVAHSDNLLNFDGDIIGEEIIDEDFNLSIPIYEPDSDGPKISVVKDGKINSSGLDSMYKEFNTIIDHLEIKIDEIREKVAAL